MKQKSKPPTKKPSKPVKSKPSSASKSFSKPAAKPSKQSKHTAPVSRRPTSGAAGKLVPVASAAAASEAHEALLALESNMQSLAGGVSLETAHAAIAELEQGVIDLEALIEDARRRGYRYKNYLERKVETLRRKWREAEPALRQEMSGAERGLLPAYNRLAERYNSALQMGAAGGGHAAAIEQGIRDLETRVRSSDAALRAVYGNVQDAYRQTKAQVDDVLWLLDEAEAASFDWLLGENPIQAVPAKWWRDGEKQGPSGVLFLSDQRLLFEQKEKVATKKVLFVTTDSETVQELAFEAPVGSVESCSASSKGLFGHQDHIDVTFSAGNTRNAHFHLDGQDSETWVALINRTANGDIQSERYYAEGETPETEQAALDQSFAEAPSKCEACGAPLDERLVKGQHQIECEYCGTVMRW
jgi:hypothetical protein